MDLYTELQPLNIRLIWLPVNNRELEPYFIGDDMEVANTMVKLKDWSKEHGVSVRSGLAKLWYPRGAVNHNLALQIAWLNLAIEVVSHYWLSSQCTHSAG